MLCVVVSGFSARCVICCRSFVVPPLLYVGCSSFVDVSSLIEVCCLLCCGCWWSFVVACVLFVVCCVLFEVWCVLFVVRCLLLVVR